MSDEKKSIDQLLLEILMSRKTRPKDLSLEFIRRNAIQLAGDGATKESLSRALDMLEVQQPIHFGKGDEPSKRLSATEMLEEANRKKSNSYIVREAAPATIELTEKERKQIESGKLSAAQRLDLANQKIAEARKLAERKK